MATHVPLGGVMSEHIIHTGQGRSRVCGSTSMRLNENSFKHSPTRSKLLPTFKI